MKNLLKLLTVFLTASLLTHGVYAQATGQLQSGQIFGNPTTAARSATGTTVGAILDRQLSCTAQGDIIFRGSSAWVCQAPGTAGFPLVSGGAGANLAYGGMVFGGLASSALATAAQYYAGAASVLVPASVIYPAEVTVTFGATTTFDFSTFINAVVTLTANITTQTLTNVTAGKSGSIVFIQDGTGSRTTVWNSIFKFPSAVAPVLTTTAGAVDILYYACRTATNCPASLTKDVR